jgi:hypothetical protein
VTLLGVPRSLSPETDAVTYRVLIDTEGDSEPDWVATWSNTLTRGSSYAASLEDVIVGRTRQGTNFPGQVETFGSTVRFVLPLKALRDPESVRLGVSAENVFMPGSEDEERITDVAPSPLWPSPNAQWLEVDIAR